MQKFRVALLGLKSLFGQASSLLLKQCPSIYNLRLYDETDISAAHDLSIINTSCKVEAYKGKNNLSEAVKGSDIVLIGDDFFSTPQTSFDIMAPKMQDYAKAIAESSPNAVIIVAAGPINKLVPVLSELLLENGNYDCNKVIGSTAVNNVRANCMLASYVHSDPRKIFLPVIGGDSEETIVPLFSQAKPDLNISEAAMRRLIDEIKHAHNNIFELKKNSEALNKAYSTVKFLNSVIAGLKGDPNVMNIAFTRTSQIDGIEYFALPVLFGRFGVQARYGIPKILPFENDLVNESVYNLKKDIDYAKLFCKSRDTAIELCSRNVANKFQKSKEFEKFVNDLKSVKKGEDNMNHKLKPPIPIETGRLPSNRGDRPFDTMAFCLKHQTNKDNAETFIPQYMKPGASISPSLLYTFKKERSDSPGLPKAFSAQTQICQPMVCPDQPKEKSINYSNIVSLVENIVKRTTEKIIKEKAIKVTNNAEECSSNHSKVEKKISEDSLTIEAEPLKGINLNNHKSGNTKLNSNDNDCNMQHAMPNKNIKNIYNSGLTSRKRKHSETKLGETLNPTLITFKERDEYKYGEIKLGSSKKGNQLSKNQPSAGLNNIEEKDLKRAEVIYPLCHSNNTRNSSHVNNCKNNNCVSNDKSFEYENKASCTADFSEFGATGGNNIRSKSIKKILKLISDDKPIKTINHKENIYNISKTYNYEKQVEHKKPLGHTGKGSEENILLENGENWPKKEIMCDNLSEYNQQTKLICPAKTYSHTAKVSEENIIFENGKNRPKKEIMSKNSGDIDGKLSESVITHNKSSENLNGLNNEKYRFVITKDEKKNYFNQRYKYKKAISKEDDKQQNACIEKKINEIDKNTEIKKIRNTIIEEDLNLPKEKIKFTNHRIIHGKPSEHIIFQSQKKTDYLKKTNSGKFVENSKKDGNNDNFNQSFRSKQSTCKFNNNNFDDALNETNFPSLRQIKQSREDRNKVLSKFDKLVKSEFYQTSNNEHQKINELGRTQSTNSETVCNEGSIGESNLTKNIEIKPIISNLDEKILISESVSNNKKHENLKKSHDAINSTHTEIIGKDLNTLLQILDNDVFKCNSIQNTKEAGEEREVKEHDSKNNEKIFPEVDEKKETEINVSPSNALTTKEETKEESIITQPERIEQVTVAAEHYQPTQKESSEPGEVNVDNNYLNINPPSQSSEEHNASLNTSNIYQDHKSLPTVKKSQLVENQTQFVIVEPESKVNHVFCNREPSYLSPEDHFAVSNKIINHKLFPELKELKQNEINFKEKSNTVNFRNSREHVPQSCTKRIIGDSLKSHIQGEVSKTVGNSRNNNNVKPKSSFTVSEKYIYKNTKSNRCGGEFINPEFSQQICDKCKQPIKINHKSEKLNNVKSNHENKSIDVNVNSKNEESSSKSDKRKLEKPKNVTSNSKFVKSWSSKYKASSASKKDMIDIGKTVNEINKTEHTLRIKDKNGIKNFFLLRNLLPKVENEIENINKRKSSGSEENTSLLKTKVPNEDPFMDLIAIKNKNSLKCNNTKSVQQKNKNKGFYTIHEDMKESDSLLITHNSVYSRKCPVHGYKYYINKNQFQDKQVNINNPNTHCHKKSDVHNSLCRISSKISDSTRSSSPHRLNQKAAYYKPYSTSAMSRHRSPSRLFMDSRKNLPRHIGAKDGLSIATTVKKPNGFRHKQNITKILEKNVKKLTVVPKTNATTQINVSKTSGLRETYKLKEVNKTQSKFMTGPIIPFHSKVPSRTDKIIEQFFNRGFDTSLAKRSLKNPPNYKSCPWMCPNATKEIGKVSRVETESFNINWKISNKKNQKFDTNSNEVNILERGTCLEHVKNKFLSNNTNKFEGKFNANESQQKNYVNSMGSNFILNSYSQYTKDLIKSEYSRSQKLPSIRQLKECAFQSS